jgi:tripartite-type tricarboxylate transporter receptor subunit TctC
MLHVPYKGSAAYINDLVGGQIPAAVDAIADLTELHRAGKVTILASSGAKRSTALPDVPTFAELGVKGVEAMGWFGFFAPAKTPQPIVDRLATEMQAVLKESAVVKRWEEIGAAASTATPAEVTRFIKAEIDKWTPVVKSTGAKPE